ncbi:MAG TPA: efflux RND transporter periplasmic adaptor subunit [Acetobacteraceae bacterium]
MRIALAFAALLALACGIALNTGVLPSRIVAEQYAAVRQLIAPAAPASAASAPVPVVVAAVCLEDVPIFLSHIGTVQAYNAVNVKTQVDGTSTQILFTGQVHVPVLAYGADDTTKLDEGTIDLVDNTVDQTTGTIKLKASFPNKDIRLWPGDFVNGRLIVDTRRGATTIPETALRPGPNGDFVWIVRPDKTAEFRAVGAGQAADGRVLIAAGVKRDELVVTEGQFRLVNDAHVEITRTEPAPPRPVAASSG